MIDSKIDFFPFWTPIAFNESKTPDTSSFSHLAWQLGSWADQYVSLSQRKLVVKAERLDAHKVYFEITKDCPVPLYWTALKITTYLLSLFTLPAIIIAAKISYKIYLNSCMALTKKSPNELIAEKQLNNTKILLLSGSLIDETTDAIVNPANPSLLPLSGVCGVIHQSSGDEPFFECLEILRGQKRSQIDHGEVVLTSAGDLAPRIKTIVHAVGPVFDAKAEKNNEILLAKAYSKSLELLVAPGNHLEWISLGVKLKPMHSIAFPSISTGIFGYPLEQAAPIALKAVKSFIETHPDAIEEVRFVFLPLDKDHQQTSVAYVEALKKLN